ncbi:MAG TPA: tRNA (adenosine(37)-N6)-dimethylallyltransferase MiaA [Longilinea sp.]|nr:tRNA (adenosine(37)-N6)-dimethylallyltransferase MiaA [Longilinea sp.]
MPLPSYPNPLIVIIGPTGVGKSELAIQLALRIHGEIISADSRYFYRGMDIGTAKPSEAELALVPHHLINIANPDERCSLASFQEQARRIISEIQGRGHLPLLVGGTGQYVRAVVEGWSPPAQAPDHTLRQALESWGHEIGYKALYDRLAIIDPEAARSIDPTNMRRTIRALEVIFLTGERFSAQRTKDPCPYSVAYIGINRPRPELYQRIDQRIDEMMAHGFVDEVQGLLSQGYDPYLPSLSAIGYREILWYLKGRVTLPEAVTCIRRSTRIYVRRQANWFKPTDPSIHWFDAGQSTLTDISDWLERTEAWKPPE